LLYFDHNATTFVTPEVAQVMSAALSEVSGNASSIHREGQKARQEVEKARRVIADFVGASPGDLVFTSGGTEANNIAILGLVRQFAEKRKHVVTTAIEHPSVLEPFKQLEREGVAVSYIPVGSDGVVKVEDIDRSLRDETVLVSVMHANNEVGTIQPVREVARLVESRRMAGQSVFLHSDGVQALGKIDVNVRDLGVDLYSISAHKLYAPKGVGCLFVRKATPLGSILFGGRHERGYRPGTENVAGVIALAKAVELCGADDQNRIAALRDRFEKQLTDSLSGIEINCGRSPRLPNTSNVLVHGASGEALLIALDMRGICISTGAACSSGSVEPSPVLLAIGRSREEAKSSVRVSFGRYNTEEDVNTLVKAMMASVAKLRTSSRLEKAIAG
jgi:cysteine desulfurase